ncbi:MAG: hypothetical protein DIU84_05030 [Bacillota bacterium]|nr:hypothetical protein [Bacillota bacterium]REJ37058.1 MAG: hypothetical protein DIU84_05030 [Bacillota bacterium]
MKPCKPLLAPGEPCPGARTRGPPEPGHRPTPTGRRRWSTVEHPEELLPERHKQWFWNRLLRLVWTFFAIWSVVAVWWHLPVQRWKEVLLFGNMPMHWYLAAFISVWCGVALIIIYHLVATRLENSFQDYLAGSWHELPEEVQAALQHARGQGD